MAELDPDTKKELRDFFDALMKETERGCVLVAAASMNNALGEMLRAGFKHYARTDRPGLDKCIDALLENGPLPPVGTFYVRTLLTYALGLINEPMRKALDAIRGMRNDAAHLDKPFSLEEYDTSHLLSLFNSLSRSLGGFLVHMDDLSKVESIKGINSQNVRMAKFIYAAVDIISRLQRIAKSPDKTNEILVEETAAFWIG